MNHKHVGWKTSTWTDNSNNGYYDAVSISIRRCSTYGDQIAEDDSLRVQVLRQIILWPDASYGSKYFYCPQYDQNEWYFNNNGNFYARITEIMGENSGNEAHVDRGKMKVYY